MKIETLIEYKDGELVDDVFELIYKVVATIHNITTDELFETVKDGLSDGECIVNKEEYEDDINGLFGNLEEIILLHLNN